MTLLLRSSELIGTFKGNNFAAWPSVCGCGLEQAALPVDAGNPPAVLASDGPSGTLSDDYMDCNVDATKAPRAITFGITTSPFLFNSGSKGFVVSALVRLRATAKSSAATTLFSVRYQRTGSGVAAVANTMPAPTADATHAHSLAPHRSTELLPLATRSR